MSGVDIRLPDFGSGSQREQMQKMQSYLFQLAGQLQFALGSVSQVQLQTARQVDAVAAAQVPGTSFAGLKSLIIKSADIVDAYYEQISRRLEGVYVAQSSFGTFRQEVSQEIQETGEEITRHFTNLQRIQGKVEDLEEALIDVSAYVKTGVLYYDSDSVPVYGVEIGQQTQENGVVQFHKYTRLCAGKLAFYDASDREVAYISDAKLFITAADVGRLEAESVQTQVLQMGSFTWRTGQDGHLTLT